MRRELEIWKRLDHPNIVQLLGTACGEDFGSDHTCMVSMWMSHGTLAEYLRQYENSLSLPSRVRLVSARDSGPFMQFVMISQITGSTAGLEYCRFKNPDFFCLSDTLPQCIRCALFMGISTLWVASLARPVNRLTFYHCRAIY